MTTAEFRGNQDPRRHALEVLEGSQQALSDAIKILSPDNPNGDPLEVLLPPSEVRDEAPSLSLTEQQAIDLRRSVASLGFERPTDLNASDLNLNGAWTVIEGGQPHKMVAEALMILDDKSAQPSVLVFSASPNRAINSDAEKASAQRLFGEVPGTEYDAARKVVEGLPGFVSKEEAMLPFSYDINNGFEIQNDASGQFIRIGQVNEIPVIIMRIDRENYKDEDGKNKYRKQPGTGDVMRILHSVISRGFDDQHSPIAFVTSGTYQLSRNIDATTVGLQTGRVVGIPTYGTKRLAEVNGTGTPEPRRLEQLPGELYVMAQQIAKLQSALNETN